MPIDLNCETLLTFGEASHHLPNRPHISTLHRWRLRGVHGVKLETVMVGGRRYTSKQALERFAVGTTAATGGSGKHPTPSSRQRDISVAERELEEAGI